VIGNILLLTKPAPMTLSHDTGDAGFGKIVYSLWILMFDIARVTELL